MCIRDSLSLGSYRFIGRLRGELGGLPYGRTGIYAFSPFYDMGEFRLRNEMETGSFRRIYEEFGNREVLGLSG